MQHWSPYVAGSASSSSGQQQWTSVMACSPDSNISSMGSSVQHLYTQVAPSTSAVPAGSQLAPRAVEYMHSRQLSGPQTAPLAAPLAVPPAAAGTGPNATIASSMLAAGSPCLMHADSDLLLAHLQLRQLGASSGSWSRATTNSSSSTSSGSGSCCLRSPP